MDDLVCKASSVVVRFKLFVQILMAVLALGICAPQSACAAGASTVKMTCCCTENSTCACQSDKPCKESCSLAPVHVFDKQMTARVGVTSSRHSNTFLYSIALINARNLALNPVVSQQESNPSPPFGGSPPQAMLRLWLL